MAAKMGVTHISGVKGYLLGDSRSLPQGYVKQMVVVLASWRRW
jgi:hypothetical protein